MIEPGWLCLELLKTRGWEARDRDDDVLDSDTRFLAWLRKEGLLSSSSIRRLRAATRKDPSEMECLLGRVQELRALLHRMFTRVSQGRLPEPSELEALEETLEETGQRLSLAPTGAGGISWRWKDQPGESFASRAPAEIVAAMSDRIVGLIARSAADLLSSGELERVKVCDAHDCGWFFVDVSRNRSRRWCDMAGCGNRSKARRYRERHT